jgi:hypothetical protein
MAVAVNARCDRDVSRWAPNTCVRSSMLAVGATFISRCPNSDVLSSEVPSCCLAEARLVAPPRAQQRPDYQPCAASTQANWGQRFGGKNRYPGCPAAQPPRMAEPSALARRRYAKVSPRLRLRTAVRALGRSSAQSNHVENREGSTSEGQHLGQIRSPYGGCTGFSVRRSKPPHCGSLAPPVSVNTSLPRDCRLIGQHEVPYRASPSALSGITIAPSGD